MGRFCKTHQWFDNTTRRPVSFAHGVMHGIARFRGFSGSKKFRRFRDNFVNFPRYQLSRLEGVSAIGPTATLL